MFILNDDDPTAIPKLKLQMSGLLAKIKGDEPALDVSVEYFQEEFEGLYPRITASLHANKHHNVVFNLDQYGYSDVDLRTVSGIMTRWPSAEVFLTFSNETVLTYLSPNQERNRVLASEEAIRTEIFEYLRDGGEVITKKEWLGFAEKTVFSKLKSLAPFVSPFSINNPNGWRYWFIHFANRTKARQVYNDVLHENSTYQAHFGRSGIHMLAYDPRDEVNLYLFDDESRKRSVEDLMDEIPRYISEHGDSMLVGDFHLGIYKETAAHSSDIDRVPFEHEDLEVITPSGNERRSPHTMKADDIIRVKRQTNFFDLLSKK